MALEIAISSSNAQRQLDALESRIDGVVAKLQGFNSTAGFDAFIDKVASFKGFAAGSVNTITALTGAIASLGTASQGLQRAEAALSRLGSLNIGNITQSVQALANSLASITVPSNLAALTANLNSIASAANATNTAVANLNRQLSATQMPAGTAQAAAGLNAMRQQAQAAGSQLDIFTTVGRGATSMLAAMGVAFTAVKVVDFVQEAYQASVAMDRFLVSMRMATGSNGAAAQSFAYLRDVAATTGQTIESLMDPFRKFMQAGTSAGYSRYQLQLVFTKFCAVFRTFGLTSEQTKRSFTALEQMMAKGTVSMEELRQQLGENVPAFSMLAKAMHVSEGELSKMISQGKVSASVIGKLADTMFDAANKSGAFGEALTKPAAQLAAFQNAFFEFQVSFGQGFIGPVIAGLQLLQQAFGNTGSITEFGKTVGYYLGYAVAVPIAAFAELVSAVREIDRAIKVTGAGFTAFGQTFVQTAEMIAQGVATIWQGITTLDFSKITQGLGIASEAITGFGSRWQQQWVEVGRSVLDAGEKTKRAGGEFETTSKAAQDLASRTQDLQKQNGQTSASAQQATQAHRGLGSAFSGAAGGAHNLTSSVYGTNSAMSSGIGIAREYAQAISEMNARTQQLNAETDALRANRQYNLVPNESTRNMPVVSSYSSGRGNSSTRYWGSSTTQSSDSFVDAYPYKTGGIAGHGRTMSVPTSAFVNAPHFASGGISDGGIPSILHPNEAVIPLQNGGVPVNLNNAGTNARSDMLLLRLVQSSYDTRQSIMDVRQSIVDASVLSENSLKSITTAVRDGNGILAGMRSEISALKVSASATSSSGGLNESPSASNASGGAVFGTSASGFQISPGLGGIGVMDSGMRKVQDRDTGQWWREANPYAEPGATVMVLNGQMGWWKETQAPGALSSFATGSPNAWKDVSGGFAATLHPDEAVIPLPDGRSVPVDMSNVDLTQGLDRYLPQDRDARRGQTPAGGAATNQTFNVRINMNVAAKDVNSFKATENQLMQDLQAKLQRAISVIGAKNAGGDDPTKRVK